MLHLHNLAEIVDRVQSWSQAWEEPRVMGTVDELVNNLVRINTELRTAQDEAIDQRDEADLQGQGSDVDVDWPAALGRWIRMTDDQTRLLTRTLLSFLSCLPPPGAASSASGGGTGDTLVEAGPRLSFPRRRASDFEGRSASYAGGPTTTTGTVSPADSTRRLAFPTPSNPGSTTVPPPLRTHRTQLSSLRSSSYSPAPTTTLNRASSLRSVFPAAPTNSVAASAWASPSRRSLVNDHKRVPRSVHSTSFVGTSIFGTTTSASESHPKHPRGAPTTITAPPPTPVGSGTESAGGDWRARVRARQVWFETQRTGSRRSSSTYAQHHSHQSEGTLANENFTPNSSMACVQGSTMNEPDGELLLRSSHSSKTRSRRSLPLSSSVSPVPSGPNAPE